MKFVTCSICEQKFYRPSQLITHVRNIHRHDPRFSFRCSLCYVICKNYRIFVRHFQKNHQQKYTNVDNDDDSSNNNASVTDENQDIENVLGDNEIDLQVEAAKSILYIKERNMITEIATNRIIEQMQCITELHLERVKEKLIELGIPLENLSDVLSCKHIFRGLETQYQREQTFTSILGLLKPQAVQFGSCLQWVKSKGAPVLKEVKPMGYFISFLDSLKRLISHKNFKKALKKTSEVSSEYIYKDVTDGSFYKSHPILSNKDTVAIIAYYDDIEVANPLGPKIKNHKLAVFYWYLANIDPAYRSQLSVINLLAVAKTKYVRKFGVDALLKDFLDGLNVLKNGYSFDINGEIITIKGSLLAFPSDTLASNYIGGFKESPSFSFSPCRICTVKKSVMKSVVSENEILLRSSSTHSDQVKKVINDNLSLHARAYWSKMYGIVRESVFSKTPYFDVTKCFVLDIMHVLFEGVVLHEIKLLLCHCLEEKYFPSVDPINKNLKIFSFIGASSADCPTELDVTIIKDPKRKIKQNAAQSWQLAVMLPFLIGQYVPDSDEHYQNFINLIKVVNLCVSFQIHSDDIVVLERLICIYISTFIKLYGNSFVTPKMHYLIHLPRQILMFGPPRYLWCFRLEAKHRKLKQSALVSQNFKNISLTVAKRLEAFACLEYSQESEFLVKETQSFNCKQIEEQLLPSYVDFNLNPLHSVFEMKSVIFKNINYTTGFYLLLNVLENEFPSFICIKHIYSVNNNAFVVCQLNNTLRYNKQLNSYVISPVNNFITLELSTLEYEHPVYAVVFQRETHIIVHHYSCIDFDYYNGCI